MLLPLWLGKKAWLNSQLSMDKVFPLMSFTSQLAPLTHLTPVFVLLGFFSCFEAPFKWVSLIQPTSSILRHYKQVTCLFPKGLVHYQYNPDAQVPALAIATFRSSNPGSVSIPNTLFNTSIDDNILAKSFKTDVATIQALKAGLAPKPWGLHSLPVITIILFFGVLFLFVCLMLSEFEAS